MCIDNRGYFVFLYDLDGEISTLAGSLADRSAWDNVMTFNDETVSLPRQFMLGKAFRGRIYFDADGSRVAAVIPIGSRPLAL